jgi:CRISPR-associated endonuclease Cas1
VNSEDTLYGRISNRVLTISGNSPSIRVDGGCLVVSDGPMAVLANHCGPTPSANERMAVLRLPRAGCPVDRIIVTRPDGFITFSAIRWLHGVGCALIQLDWDGTVLLATAPVGPDRPSIRRGQALAAGDATGLAIMREILRYKLAGQARVARLLGGEDAATLIDCLASEIDHTIDGRHLLGIEGAAAKTYWALWHDLPLHFARRDRASEHWQSFGLRRPEGSDTARKAATPGVALLNYLYGVLAGETTIALLGAGLDPGIGVFHGDRENRASLAYDAMEAARPYAEAWLLSSIAESRFSKRDFHEEADGTIRITRPLTSYLAMTAPLWRRAAETVAAWLAESFAGFARRLDARGVDDVIATASIGIPSNTQKTSDPPSRSQLSPRAVGRLPRPLPAPLPNLASAARAYRSTLAHGVMPRACYECGRALAPTQRKFCSAPCTDNYRVEMRRLLPLSAGAAISPAIRELRFSEEARSANLRRVSAERRAWDSTHKLVEAGGGRQAEIAAIEQLRRWYAAQVQPRLAGLQPKDIVGAIEVSRAYARQVIGGQIPHRRHFGALAKLAGVSAPKALKLAPPLVHATAASEPQSTPDHGSEKECVK